MPSAHNHPPVPFPARAFAACLAISCVLAGAPAASSRSFAQPPNQPRATGGLQALDPGMQDLDPLRTSLRLQPVDLRQPMDFDKVYRLPGNGATDRLVRMSGALAAVFPRSDYVPTENGVVALVPAGTIFHIGGIPTAAPAPAPRAIAPGSAAATVNDRTALAIPQDIALPIDGRDPPATQVLVRKDATTPHAPAAIMTDERYRAARVRQLLETAAAASPNTR